MGILSILGKVMEGQGNLGPSCTRSAMDGGEKSGGQRKEVRKKETPGMVWRRRGEESLGGRNQKNR